MPSSICGRLISPHERWALSVGTTRPYHGANERQDQDEEPERFWLPPGRCRCNKIGIS
jgi:hypothetical protein